MRARVHRDCLGVSQVDAPVGSSISFGLPVSVQRLFEDIKAYPRLRLDCLSPFILRLLIEESLKPTVYSLAQLGQCQ